MTELDRDRIWAELQPELDRIAVDGKRRRPIGLLWLAAGLAAIAGAVVLLVQAATVGQEMVAVTLGVVSVIAALIGIGQLSMKGGRLELAVRTKVFEKAGLTFRPVADLPVDRFVDLGLVPEHDQARLRDHLSGRFAGTEVDMVRVELFKRRRGPLGKSAGTDGHRLYSGTLITCPSPGPAVHRTTIIPDPLRSGYKPLPNASKGERVRFGMTGFDEAYLVHSTDESEARALITARFRERMMDTQNALDDRERGAILCVGFADDRMLLAVLSKRPWFAPPTGDGKAMLDGYLADLARLRAVLEQLLVTERHPD